MICAHETHVIIREMRTTSLRTPGSLFRTRILARATLSLPNSAWEGKIGHAKQTGHQRASPLPVPGQSEMAQRNTKVQVTQAREHTHTYADSSIPSPSFDAFRYSRPFAYSQNISHFTCLRRQSHRPSGNDDNHYRTRQQARPNRDTWAQMSLQLMERERAHKHGEGVGMCVCTRETKGWRKRGHVYSNLQILAEIKIIKTSLWIDFHS